MGAKSQAEAETGEEERLKTRSTTPPKLSLFSRIPHQSSELSAATGMLTPPLRARASVPFCWEEQPGKPLHNAAAIVTARCLELPPRLQMADSSAFNSKLFSSSSRNLSPTTVLDGPYVGHGRSSSFTSFSFSRDPLPPPPVESFRRGESPDDTEGNGNLLQLGSLVHGQRREISISKGYFGSWGRKASSKLNQNVGEGGFVFSRSSSSASVPVVLEVEIGETEDAGIATPNVKITRFKRTGSFLSPPYSKSSQLWESICHGLKQVVPWRRRKTKKKLTV